MNHSSIGKLTAAAMILTAVAATTTIAGVKVQSQSDQKFAFATLKTWAWNPSGPGDVKVWVTAESDPAPVKRQVEPVIMQAVDEQLAKRNFTRAEGQPDFFVTYYVLVTLGMSSQQLGQFLPSLSEWGVPPFTAPTTSLKIYPEGSLVLDVAAGSTEHVVWRGVAQSEVKPDASDAERTKRVRDAVKDLLEKFPPKK
jgi:ABC-type glycerol-3-phosphate transport system substrate-binding protein